VRTRGAGCFNSSCQLAPGLGTKPGLSPVAPTSGRPGLVVGLRTATRRGRRGRSTPGLRGFPHIAGTLLGDAGPVGELRITSVGAPKRKLTGRLAEWLPRLEIASASRKRLAWISVWARRSVPRPSDPPHSGWRLRPPRKCGWPWSGWPHRAGRWPSGGQCAVEGVVPARHHGGIFLEQRQALFERTPACS